MTAVMLDDTAESLRRMWVVFEMTETKKLKQPLEFWTPLGRVGSGLVSSGPFRVAVDNLDITKASASNPCDQRQILNHVAGIHELTGINLDSRRNKELDPAQPQGRYEAQLIEHNVEEFKKWNTMLKTDVRTLFHSRTSLSGDAVQCSIPDMTLRGITLEQLRTFAQEVTDWLGDLEFNDLEDDEGEKITAETASLHFIFHHYISQRLADAERDCSFVELVAKQEQQPEYHVTSSWRSTFQEVMAAIEWHAQARQLSDATAYWFDMLALNGEGSSNTKRRLHVGKTVQSINSTQSINRQQSNRIGEADDAIVQQVIRDHAAGVLVVMDAKHRCLSRGLVVFEAYLAIEYSKSLDFATANGGLATTRPFADGAWTFGDFDSEIAESALNFDVRNIEFTDEKLKRAVFNVISSNNMYAAQDLESPPPRSTIYHEFNLRFRAKFAGPALQQAAFAGSVATIESIFECCPDLKVNAKSLQGHLGERALHCASAAGHVEVVQHLIGLDSDPNVEDFEGETALHYASLAGHLEIVQFLLANGADPWNESFSAEWPNEVADQNPAFFLGVETKEVGDRLRTVMNESLTRDKRTDDRMAFDSQSITRLRGQITRLEAENARLKSGSKERVSVASDYPPPSTGRQCVAARLRQISPAQLECLTWANLQLVLERIGLVDPALSRHLVDLAQTGVAEGAVPGTVDVEAFLEWLYNDS